jgi:hypothetical protein
MSQISGAVISLGIASVRGSPEAAEICDSETRPFATDGVKTRSPFETEARIVPSDGSPCE